MKDWFTRLFKFLSGGWRSCWRSDSLDWESAEEELRKLSRAVEQSANAVIITDLDAKIEFVNPAFTVMTGYTYSEVMGKNPRILKSGKHSDEFYRILWATLLRGEVWQGEFLNRRKDGTLYWESASISPIKGPEGEITHYLAVKDDVTARKEAEEALSHYTERLRLLHEIDQAILAAHLPGTIALVALGRIRYLIPCQRVSVLEFDLEEGATVLAVEADPGLRTDLEKKLRAVGVIEFKKERVSGVEDLTKVARHTPLQKLLYAEGVRSYILVPLRVQQDVIGVLNLEAREPCFFTQEYVDIAIEVAALLAVAIRQARLHASVKQELVERKRAEAALRENEAKLREYATELERQNADLDAFAHTVAHDLKNPLSALLGLSGLLENYFERLSEDKVRDNLQKITQIGRKMTDIIESLLLLASVRQQDDVALEPLDMADIVSEIQTRLDEMIMLYQAEITAPETWPVVLGYAPWVEEVWVNYITNALKYGGDPPRVQLGFDTLMPSAATNPELNGSGIRFWVRDNGPGIALEAQSRLFSSFMRLEQVRVEGHGLGLSIVKRIVEKLGGEVGVESDEGGGSLFFFTLPLAEPVSVLEDVSADFALAGQFSMAALAGMSVDWRTDLKHATMAGDWSLIKHLIAQVYDYDVGLANALSELAHNFKYRYILSLLDQVSDEEEMYG